jgi:hypothetical protein
MNGSSIKVLQRAARTQNAGVLEPANSLSERPQLDFIQLCPSGRVTQGRKQPILYPGRKFRAVTV